jgi:hypothetical protein
MKRKLVAEIIEGFEALAVHRLGQRALPLPEVESMTPLSDPMEGLVALERELHDPAVRRDRAPITSDGFALTALGADAALLTYRTAERLADGSDIRHAHRSIVAVRGGPKLRTGAPRRCLDRSRRTLPHLPDTRCRTMRCDFIQKSVH